MMSTFRKNGVLLKKISGCNSLTSLMIAFRLQRTAAASMILNSFQQSDESRAKSGGNNPATTANAAYG
jgi:hypothetical protein